MKHSRKLRFVTLSIGILLVSFCHAQDTLRLGVNDILGRMDTTYPVLLSYSQKINAIQQRSEGAQSWMPPVISIGVDRWGYQPSMWMEESPMNQAGIMFSAEQMIPNPNKLNARSNAIAAQTQPIQYDSAWLRNDLRAKVRIYYYQRFIAERKLQILNQNIAVLDMLIATAEAKYAVNQADLSTIFKAKARKAELMNMQLMLQAQIAESNIGLNTLMNRDVNTPFTIDTTITLLSLPDSITFDSLKVRSDIQTMNANIQAMRQQQNAMRAEQGPDFGIRVTHMQMLGMPNQFSVMGMMIIPLAPWSSGMYRSEVNAMDFEIRDMELQKESMQLMANQMAAERAAMLKFEMQQLINYDSLVIPAYKNNYEASLLAYQNNTGNFFVLLDAWDMLLMKQLEAADQLSKVLVLQTAYQYEVEE